MEVALTVILALAIALILAAVLVYGFERRAQDHRPASCSSS